MTKKKTEYPPELSQPIFVNALAALSAGKLREELIFEARKAKFHLLLKHHRIDPTDPDAFLFLAFDLACKHIGGFAVTKTPPRAVGRPKTKNSMDMVELYGEIQHLRDKGHSLSRACELLAKRKTSRWHGKNPLTLANQWREAKKEVARLNASGAKRNLAQLEGLRELFFPTGPQKLARE